MVKQKSPPGLKPKKVKGRIEVLKAIPYRGIMVYLRRINDDIFEYLIPYKGEIYSDYLIITPKKGKKKNGSGNWNNNSKRKKTAWNDSELSDDEGNEGEDPEQTSKDSTTEPSPGSRVSSIPIEELVKRVTSNDIDYDMLAILVQHLVKTKERDE